MNRAASIFIPISIVAVGIVGLLILGQAPEVTKDDRKDDVQATLVEVSKVTEWKDPIHVVTDGEATTYRVATLSSEVAGRIKNKPDDSRGGKFVHKDQTLFEIDSTNYRLQAERLAVQLTQNTEEQQSTRIDITNTVELIKLAKEELAIQENQLARLRNLKQRGTANDREVEEAMKQQLISRNALQNLENSKRTFEQKLKTQAAGANVIQSERDRVKTDLERCVVRSPLTGRMVDDLVETGDYVQVGDELAHISDSSRMEIRTKLRAEQLAWIWLQHQVEKNPLSSAAPAKKSADPLNLPAVACEIAYEFEGIETIWDGYISSLEGTGIDRDTRTFPCRVLVEEPTRTRVSMGDEDKRSVRPPGLLSGMYVTVRIPVVSPTRLLRVPLEAIRPGGQIWVKRNKKLEIIKATPAYTFEDNALLRADGCPLQEGDEVITSPLPSVTNNLQVMTVEEQEAAIKSSSKTTAKQKPSPKQSADAAQQTDAAASKEKSE